MKMSSFEEEERLVQMVHDFIESSPSSSKFLLSSLHQQPSCLLSLQRILMSGNTEAEKEVAEKVKKHILRSRSSNNLKKCLVKKLKMDGFKASLCHTSWSTSLGCPAGDYEYIDIIMEDEQNEEELKRLIVDIDFKSQFELARPTETYKELINKLPPIFVGEEEKLNKIISLLCSEAKQSLKERGLHIPPWRTSTYMHSKWLSTWCHKCSEKIAGNESTSIGNNNNNVSMVKKKTKRGTFVGGDGSDSSASNKGGVCSGLSSQFSNTGINCC